MDLLTTLSAYAVSAALGAAALVTFGYWIPLTALAVLQPDGHSSRVRALQRTTGTLLGTAAVVVVAEVTDATGVIVALVAVAAFALFALRSRSYHWLVTLLTPTALLMISTVGFDGRDLALDRLGTTAAGVALALAAAAVVPRHPDVSGAGQGSGTTSSS